MLILQGRAPMQVLASSVQRKFTYGFPFPILRRYCYEEDFCEAAPRQRDGVVWQQSDSL